MTKTKLSSVAFETRNAVILNHLSTVSVYAILFVLSVLMILAFLLVVLGLNGGQFVEMVANVATFSLGCGLLFSLYVIYISSKLTLFVDK